MGVWLGLMAFNRIIIDRVRANDLLGGLTSIFRSFQVRFDYVFLAHLIRKAQHLFHCNFSSTFMSNEPPVWKNVFK